MNTQQQAQYIIDNAIMVDTETTGLRDTDQVIELCAIKASTGAVLLDTLVYNDGADVEPEALAVNGITTEMMAGGRPVAELIQRLFKIKNEHDAFLTAYNVPFDSRLINQTATANNLRPVLFNGLECSTICAMEVANRHFVAEHGVWDSDRSQFKRLSLSRCCEIAGIKYEGDAHRAYADTKAAVDLMRAIAEGQA